MHLYIIITFFTSESDSSSSTSSSSSSSSSDLVITVEQDEDEGVVASGKKPAPVKTQDELLIEVSEHVQCYQYQCYMCRRRVF